MQFVIKINMDGEAFVGNPDKEISHILNEIALEPSAYTEPDGLSVLDGSGQRAGKVEIIDAALTFDSAMSAIDAFEKLCKTIRQGLQDHA